MPPITEAKLYEAFGLTPPEGQGAQVQEPAAPAAEGIQADTDTGAQVQEPAAPAEGSADPVQKPSAEPDEEPEGSDTETAEEPASGKRPLSPEERKANAARRRQQEQQAAIDQAVADALKAEKVKTDAAMQDFFAAAGLKNTFTGEPIKSMEEFQAWKKAFDSSEMERKLKAGKLTPDILEQLIAQHPMMKQAQQVIEEGQAAQRQQQEAADKARIDAEMKEITALDPNIKTVADLLNMPTGSQFREYVKKGLGFKDAFYLANRERLAEEKAKAAKQQALNNARGKEHLVSTGNARGNGAASVPADQMRLFRMLNPTASEQDIQNFYNKYKSSQGG